MKNTQQSINILLGIIIGLIANSFYTLFLNTNFVRMISIIILLIITIFLIAYNSKITSALELIERYKIHKLSLPFKNTFQAGSIISTNVPEYIVQIGDYFTEQDIKTLYKKKLFSSHEEYILRNMSLLK